MKLRTFKSLKDDVYKVTIYTEDWSTNDINLMLKFGEPEIDLGGEFEEPDFTLNTNLVRIKTESPFNVSFDARDYEDAEERADLWATTISERITTAVTTLRAQSDTFTSETVENI